MTRKANTGKAIPGRVGVPAACRGLAAVILLAWVTSAVYAGGGPPPGRRGPPPEALQALERAREGLRGLGGPRGPLAPGGEEGPVQPPRGVTPAAASPPQAGAIPVARGAKTIAMNFYDLDIDHLLRLLSEAAGVTIYKSDQVTGKVTVIAPEPVSIEEAFQILNSVLDVRGFTMVQTANGLYEVIPKSQAMQSALPLKFGARPEEVRPGDELITQVIPLKHLDASDLASQIQGLLSQEASLIPTSTNRLIVTDTAARIQRVLTLIADTEEQLSGGLKVFPLQYYDASEMANLVGSLVLARAGAAAAGPRPAWEQRVRVAAPGAARLPVRPAAPRAAAPAGAGPEFCYPDTRTNSLIVLATPTHLQQIEQLIAGLDRPVSLRGTYFVYPVQNLVASELAQLIGPQVGAQVSVQAPGAQPARPGAGIGPSAQVPAPRGAGPRFRGTPTSGIGLGPARLILDRSGENQHASALELEPLGGPAEGEGPPVPTMPLPPPAGMPEQVAPQPEQPPPGPEAEIAEEREEVAGAAAREAMITADDNANVLLISAPPEQIELLRELLEQLDVLPPQVHIRAIIAEVSLTRDTSLGFQWNKLPVLKPYGGAFTGEFTTNFGITTPANGDQAKAPLGLFGQISGEDFEAVLTALTTDSHVRILATPSIFTSNNQQATIDVSKGIPFVTSTSRYEQTGSTYSSVEYKSVGIVLEVTPRVTQGNVVQMQVHVTSNELGEYITVGEDRYASTNQRVADATLNIRDGYTIVLGGLMRDTILRSSNKVPILGDLPILGSLFRTSNSKREKSELLVFLTPHVVRTPAEAAQVTEAEKSKLPEVPRSLQPPAGGPAPAEKIPAPSQ